MADVNSSESLWAFVPLGFCQTGKVPQLLQPDGPTSSPLCMEDSPSIVSPSMGRAAKAVWAAPGPAQGFLNPHRKEEGLGGHGAQNKATDPKGLRPLTRFFPCES